jgi:hypothetical protein
MTALKEIPKGKVINIRYSCTIERETYTWDERFNVYSKKGAVSSVGRERTECKSSYHEP